MERSIDHQLFYSHPASIVWEYLTNPDLVALWLMKSDIKPVEGHEFRFRTGPLPAMRFDGIVYCKILEVVPFKKLVYSWKGGPAEGVITMDSIVTWTLDESATGTMLTLHHSGFEHVDSFNIFSAMDHGWIENMHKITSLLQRARDEQTQR